MGAECIPARNRSHSVGKFQKELQSNSNTTKCMKVVIETWLLDRAKLFDQQDQDNLSVTSHRVNQTGFLYKKIGGDAQLLKNLPENGGQDEDEQAQQLGLTLRKVQDGFIVYHHGSKDKTPWQRVFENWAHVPLGSSFKAGSTVFSLKKVVTDQNYLINQHKSERIQSIAQMGEHDCRICLDSTYSQNNPLISPCQCMGSVKYIHLRCLKQWLLAAENKCDDYITIDLKKSKCQICKATFLDSPVYQSIISTILSGQKSIPTPFTVFEGSITDKTRNQLKSYFIYSFKNKKVLTIGRGKKVDMRNDIDRSISRTHAEVTLKGQNLMVRDCGSKFGTLKKIYFPLFIPFGKEVYKMQTGATSLTIFFQREIRRLEVDKQNYASITLNKISSSKSQDNPNGILPKQILINNGSMAIE